MKTVCSYCGRTIKIVDGEDRVTSHGICEECGWKLCNMLYYGIADLVPSVEPASDEVRRTPDAARGDDQPLQDGAEPLAVLPSASSGDQDDHD